MQKRAKTAVYDAALQLEAYRLMGIGRPFPSHFHEYYVFGLMERGARRLACSGAAHDLRAGDVVLFNPGDSHACIETDGGSFDYLGLNLSRDSMQNWMAALGGARALPKFSPNAIRDPEAAELLRALHGQILRGDAGRRAILLRTLALLTERCGCTPVHAEECPAEVEAACAFMRRHHAEAIHLEDVCRSVGLSKSTLLRAFARAKGVTPHVYLENIRVGEARKLLERGVSTVDSALLTGFSDQSHFTNCFRRFIGLTPGSYRRLFSTPSPAQNQSAQEEVSHESAEHEMRDGDR